MLNDLLKLLETGTDNALLRFSIGNAYLKKQDMAQAREHLAKAVELDPEYSAAWKIYGKTLQQMGETELAKKVLIKVVEVAGKRGDIQAVKEMQVFLKRLQKNE